MKKPALPIPEKYGFDDTPKAFTRMMQRKNNEKNNEFKRFKSDEPSPSLQASSVKRKYNEFNHLESSVNTKSQAGPKSSAGNTITPKSNISSGFKTIRSKRKAHLQSRDLKKKLKKFDSSADNHVSQSSFSRDVRDVVQEPPKLHQPKKAFKKIKDEREKVRAWSDLDDNVIDE